MLPQCLKASNLENVDWLYFTPAVIIAVLLLFAPGIGVLLALRVRRLAIYTIAPAISISLIGMTAVVFGSLGIRWGTLPVAITIALVLLLALSLRALVEHLNPTARGTTESLNSSRQSCIAPFTALALAAFILAIQLAFVMGSPQNFMQEADNILHLNIIRDILNTGNASSFAVTSLILPEGSSSFYPAAFHALASLVAEIGSGDVVAGENAVLFALMTLVWPIGILGLVAAIFKPTGRFRKALYLSAGLMSTGFVGFPLTVLGLGGTFPYFTAISFLPGLLAVFLILVFRLPQLGREWFGVCLALPALILTHPSSAHSIALLAIGALTVTGITLYRNPKVHKTFLSVAAALMLISLIWFWINIATSGLRNDYFGLVVAGGQLLLTSYNVLAFSPLAIVAVIAGVGMMVWKKKTLWWLFSAMLAGIFYLLAAAVQSHPVRDALVAPWYADPARIYGIYTVTLIPIASFALAKGYLWLRRFIPKRATFEFLTQLAVITTIVLSQSFAIPAQIARTSPMFQHHDDDNYWLSLSEDEARLLRLLPDIIPPGEVVAGSHFTGASYAYALSNVKVLNPQYTWQPLRIHEKNIIHESLNQALIDPAVCEAVQNQNVHWVLDFGDFPRSADDPQAQLYRGLDNLIESGVAELYTIVGKAKLLKVTAC